MQKKLKDNDELRQKAFSGMLWKLLEKIGVQVVQFVLQIVLARLLLPSEYGIVGLLAIFIAISDVFISQGFTTALIQKKNADQVDFSSVYFANLMLGVVLYAILYFISPAVASFYHEPSLVSLMRVLSLNVLIGSFGAVHNAVLTRELAFKKSFYRNLFNILTQGIVGVALAYRGYGAWAIVYSKVAGVIVGTLTLVISVHWKPNLFFSFTRIRSLFRYSSKVLVTNLLNTFFNNMHSLIIGRYFTSSDLGYYQRGQQMPQAAMTAIDGSFNEVLYPTLSVVQDDTETLKRTLRRSMKTSMFFVFPLMFGMMATAESLVKVLLTDVWLPCVPFIQLSCIVCLFWPFSARNHALNALGKSGETLKVSIVSKVLTLVLIFASVNLGIYAIMISTIIASLISFAITTVYIRRFIGYTFAEVIKDMLPMLIISFIMFVVVYIIGLLYINIYAKFSLQITMGMFVYIALIKLFRVDSFEYTKNLIKSIIKR